MIDGSCRGRADLRVTMPKLACSHGRGNEPVFGVFIEGRPTQKCEARSAPVVTGAVGATGGELLLHRFKAEPPARRRLRTVPGVDGY